MNNLYTYESSVIKIGSKRFEINKDDHNEYIVVVASKLKDDVVAREVFNQ